MKEFKFFTGFWVFLFMISCAVTADKTDWQKDHLKGKIKSYTETTYKPNENPEITAIGNGQKVKRISKFFTIRGKIEKVFSEVGAEEVSKRFYTYDSENGNLIKKSIYEPNGRLKNTMVYTYDADGHLSESDWYAWKNSDSIYGSKYVYTYDGQGNPIKKQVYSSDDRLVATKDCKYDSDGNRIEEQMDFICCDNLDKKTKFKYDKSGHEIEANYYGPNGELRKSYSKMYNDKGDLAQRKTENAQGEIYTYKYNYDQENNWIKCIKLKDNKPVHIVTRDISYFEN